MKHGITFTKVLDEVRLANLVKVEQRARLAIQIASFTSGNSYLMACRVRNAAISQLSKFGVLRFTFLPVEVRIASGKQRHASRTWQGPIFAIPSGHDEGRPMAQRLA